LNAAGRLVHGSFIQLSATGTLVACVHA
jgi:hypothetical protein